jgi:hypothetical protein
LITAPVLLSGRRRRRHSAILNWRRLRLEQVLRRRRGDVGCYTRVEVRDVRWGRSATSASQ